MTRAIPCLALLLVSACMVQNNKQKLAESLHSYNEAVRWGSLERAAEHVAPEGRSTLLQPRADFGDLRVTGCHVGQVALKGKGKATARVRIDWYLASQLRVRSSLVEQRWRLKSGTWQIVSQRLVGGAPCPLLVPRTASRSPLS